MSAEIMAHQQESLFDAEPYTDHFLEAMQDFLTAVENGDDSFAVAIDYSGGNTQTHHWQLPEEEGEALQ